MPQPPLPAFRLACVAAAALGALLLAACGSAPLQSAKPYEPEDFDSTTTYTRSYAVDAAHTCEAARRALLSQGYLISSATAEQVTGRKNFQPEPEVHLEMEFRVVCTGGQGGAPGSTAFVTAVQERYALKKANSSASVGVSSIASVSLPFNASSEAMVKVGSQTLTDQVFYNRFFLLIERYIANPNAPQARRDSQPPALTAPVSTPVAHQPQLEAQALAPQPPAAAPAQAETQPAQLPEPGPMRSPAPLTADQG
jgi:hypothetical protein